MNVSQIEKGKFLEKKNDGESRKKMRSRLAIRMIDKGVLNIRVFERWQGYRPTTYL